MIRGKYLRDAAAAVVTNKVNLVQLEGVEKLHEHLRLCIRGDILVRFDLALSVG